MQNWTLICLLLFLTILPFTGIERKQNGAAVTLPRLK